MLMGVEMDLEALAAFALGSLAGYSTPLMAAR